METSTFLGLECHALENEQLKLLVMRSAGPRILSFGFKDGDNLFAELPDARIDDFGGDAFHFYGGHRLWHAPEEPRRTYLPDDFPVDIVSAENGLTVTQKTEAQTGLQKMIEIRLPGESPQVIITHYLTNQGLWPVTCAPWAITQLKPGGTAILPQTRQDTGVLPNRSLALWPYTDMVNPNVRWGSNYILLDAELDSPFKIGFPNPRGWLAYWWNGTLFVKRAEYDAQAEYFDFGSSSECYCNDQFIELETLSPIRTIAPGETVSHIETWELYREIDRPRHESDAQRIVDALGLE
ncbi:MAG TPA: hypothetical protein VFH34_12945 [Anaerolineales bacterium]|nr:hypothetical protein [Anaerolineales bacterium]